MRIFENQNITRGVKQSIPNIIQHEIWEHWESVTKPGEDSVVEVSLLPHLFNHKAERIAIRRPRRVRVVHTNEIVTAELIITYFDGVATMLLRGEAEKIFGDLLTEYLHESVYTE